MKTFEHLQHEVISWGTERNLMKPENANKQFLKVIEEVGELASGVAKNNQAAIIDGMGDVLVTLIILSEQLGIDPVQCLESAYAEISNRKGTTVNGVFIKE